MRFYNFFDVENELNLFYHYPLVLATITPLET